MRCVTWDRRGAQLAAASCGVVMTIVCGQGQPRRRTCRTVRDLGNPKVAAVHLGAYTAVICRCSIRFRGINKSSGMPAPSSRGLNSDGVSQGEFDSVRAEADPLRQARRATDLLAVYQQRSMELARLRRDAIDRAATELGMTYSAVAAAVGVSKGRVTQIRHSAPPTERAFFGVGPVTVAIPERMMPGRALPVISSEDALTAEVLTGLLQGLSFQVRSVRVPATGRWQPPPGDVVAICGPKSSPTIAEVLAADPLLDFAPDDAGHWRIRDRDTGLVWGSGMDEDPPRAEDVAYLGRVSHQGRTLLVVAGVHAIGSLGALTWLAEHLRQTHQTVGAQPFSMVVRSTYDGPRITGSEVMCPPRAY